MKILRIWGLLVSLFLAMLFLALWYLLLPSIVKTGIEETGSELVGVQVNLDSVELNLFPLAVSLDRLQVTDVDQPMKNLVEINKISFGIDSNALLWKKVLIEELTLDGVQLATDRDSSGYLEGGRATEQLATKVSNIEIPNMTEEDITQLVEKADLLTVKRLEELNKSQQEMNEYWRSVLDQKSLEADIAAIESEFNRLKGRLKENKMNLIADRKDWKKLKKAIDAQRKKIAELKTKFDSDKLIVQNQIALVKNGPKDDKEAILKNLGLGNGASGLSDKFLGPEYTPWVKKLLSLTEGVTGENSNPSEDLNAPAVYSTAQGTKVQFKDEQIFPDILIKKIVLSGKEKTWNLSGLGTNLGHLPWLVGQPAKLDIKLKGENKSDRNANLELVSEWKSKQQMRSDISSQISNWPINQLKLMQTSDGSWFVSSGTFDATLSGNLTLETISMNLSVNLKDPKISPPENLTGWQQSIASSLNNQKSLRIDLRAEGPIDNPSIKVTSSIEKILAQAIGDQLKKQAEKYSKGLTSAISNKVGDLSNLDGTLADFDQWESTLAGNDELLKKLRSGI